jgi:hypothetical protein
VALGASKGKGFRIAHMGHVNAPMLFGTLGAVEMALGALGMPHGRGGVGAAVEFWPGRWGVSAALVIPAKVGIQPFIGFEPRQRRKPKRHM